MTRATCSGCDDSFDDLDLSPCELCRAELCTECLRKHAEGECPAFIDESEFDWS